jgi:hypothetical protein
MPDPFTAYLPSGGLPAPNPPAAGIEQLYANYQQSQGNQSQQGTQTNLNQFTPQQQQLQGMLPGMLSGFLSGQQDIPAYMTAPPQVFKAYNDAFQKYTAPGIAAQFGAGSPQIGAQQSFGNQQLAAQLYQSGVNNWMQGLGLGGNWAYTPIGQNAANQASGQSQNNTFGGGIVDTTYGASILSTLLNALAGA